MPRDRVTRSASPARGRALDRPDVTGRSSGVVVASGGSSGGSTAPPPETTPAAVLSTPVVDQITQTSARINWTTDIVTQGYIEYGATSSYGSQTSLGASATLDAQLITGLTANTTYHYRVVVRNALGTVTNGSDGTFTTLAADTTRPTVVTSFTYVPLVSAAQPAYLGTHNDAIFGVNLKRISDTVGRRHIYALIPAWNADGSLLNLGYSTGRAMLRGSDYTVLQSNQSGTSTLVWYHTDATRGWCQNGANNGLRKLVFNTTTGAITSSTTYAATSITRPGGGVYSEVSFGGINNGIQGIQDDADAYVAFMWRASSGDWGIGVYNLSTNAVHAERTMGNSVSTLASGALMDNCGMSHTGDWAWFTFTPDGTGTTQGMWLYEADLNTTTRIQASTSQEHCDWATTGAGVDRFVYWNGNITSMDPVTGTKTVLLTPVLGGTHISGRAWGYPGWVLVSQHQGYLYTDPGCGTVFALSIDNPGNAMVYCHQHKTQAATSPSAYAGEVHAVPNKDLTLILMAINWESSGSVYSIVAGKSV